MDLVSGLAVYFMLWWVVIFTVLPFGGNKPPEDVEEGHATSAPANPRLKQKFIATTVISAVLWVIIDLIVISDVISFYDMADALWKKHE